MAEPPDLTTDAITENASCFWPSDNRPVPPGQREITMDYTPDREWFVNLGRMQSLDLVIQDIREVYPEPSDLPDELHAVVFKMFLTAADLQEKLFDEDNLPNGVEWRDA